MKLYESSIFSTSRHSMTFTGISDSNDIRPAVDNDKNTLASSNTANPSFSVNFGTGETRAASAIWIRVEGYTRVQVNAGSSEVADVAIGADGYAYAEFSEASDQNWTLRISRVPGGSMRFICVASCSILIRMTGVRCGGGCRGMWDCSFVRRVGI